MSRPGICTPAGLLGCYKGAAVVLLVDQNSTRCRGRRGRQLWPLPGYGSAGVQTPVVGWLPRMLLPPPEETTGDSRHRHDGGGQLTGGTSGMTIKTIRWMTAGMGWKGRMTAGRGGMGRKTAGMGWKERMTAGRAGTERMTAGRHGRTLTTVGRRR